MFGKIKPTMFCFDCKAVWKVILEPNYREEDIGKNGKVDDRQVRWCPFCGSSEVETDV